MFNKTYLVHVVFHLISLTNFRKDLIKRKIDINIGVHSLSACLKTLTQAPWNQTNSSSAEEETSHIPSHPKVRNRFARP